MSQPEVFLLREELEAIIKAQTRTIATLTAEREVLLEENQALQDAVAGVINIEAATRAELGFVVEERDALRTALEEVQLRARIMSVPDADCGEEVLRDVFANIADLAREALGGKS